MQNNCLIILMALLSMTHAVMAQESSYHPFLKEGKTWNCRLTERVNETANNVETCYLQTTTYGLRINGDTVINGTTYKKLYKDIDYMERTLLYAYPADAGNSLEQQQRIEVNTVLMDDCLREEDGKVYEYLPNRQSEILLYDFSLCVGEYCPEGYAGPRTCINNIDTVAVDNRPFRRFHLSIENIGDKADRIWIEGVGHPNGLLQVWGAELNDGKTYEMLSCYEDGQCIFTSNDFYSPKFEDVDNILHFHQNNMNKNNTNPCYDLQGRRLAQQPQRGLYVRDGKKYTVR